MPSFITFNRLLRPIQLIGMLCVCLFSSSTLAWFDNNWPYRAHIELSNNSGGNVTDQSFNINLAAADLHPDYTWTSAGADLRVYDTDDLTPLDFHIEYWNQGSQTARVLIKTDLNNGQSKTIYFYYGHTSGASPDNIAAILTEPGLRFHTRLGPYIPAGTPTLAEVETAFDAIADGGGYDCAAVTNFTNLSNSGSPIFGNAANIFFRAEHWFYVDAIDAGEWRFEYSGDYGNGGALFLNEVELHDRWGEDLWWDNTWTEVGEILRTNGSNTDPDAAGHPILAVGWNVLKFFGSEQCCDGGTSVRFQKPSLAKGAGVGDPSAELNGWYEWSLANHPMIRSPSCSTSNFPTALTSPVLATSTKSSMDLNGGTLDPGDIIRYTITLTESNFQAIEKVSLIDDMSAENISNVSIVSLPAGAIGTDPGSTVSVNNINFAGAATVVFDATINAGAPLGSTINNSFDYDSPGSSLTTAQGTINANTLTIYDPPPPTVTKTLYLIDSDELSRFIDAGNRTNTNLTTGNNNTWTLIPDLQQDFTLDDNFDIEVSLVLRRRGNGGQGNDRDFTITIGDTTGTDIGSLNVSETLSDTFTLYGPYAITINKTAIASGNPITLNIENTTAGNGQRRMIARDIINTGSSVSSIVDLPAATYIDVTTVEFYDAAYPGGSIVTELTPGDSVWVRATVTDPFGFADITGVTFDAIDPSPATINSYTDADPEVVEESASNATKIYELTYQIPAFPVFGNWTFTVTANEGDEGLVTDSRSNTVTVTAPPDVSVLKSANVTNANPGDIITYSIALTNTGQGDAFNVLITDTLSTYTPLRLQFNGTDATPFSCSAGCTTSGLSITPGSEEYNDSNNLWNHILTSGGGGAPTGYDGDTTEWRIPLAGQLNNTNVTLPDTNVYTLQFQTIIE